MSVLLSTPWKFVTSEEKAGTLFATVAVGKLYFENDDSGEKLTLKYRSIGLGHGKGPPVGASWSNTSDPSSASGNVGVVEGHYFGPLSFPCRGYMLGLGASSGVVGSILGASETGGSFTIAFFDLAPVFAPVRMWGLGRAALPGVAIGGGLALFELDS